MTTDTPRDPSAATPAMTPEQTPPAMPDEGYADLYGECIMLMREQFERVGVSAAFADDGARIVVERLIAAEAALATREASPGSEGALRVAADIEADLAYVHETLRLVFEKRGRLRDGVLASRVNMAAHRLANARRALSANPLPEASRHHPEYLRGIRDGAEACERAVFRAFDQEPDGTPIASFALHMSARLEKAEAAWRDDGEVGRLRMELALAEQRFDTVRVNLIKELEEPARSAFWTAIDAGNRIRTILAATDPVRS